MLDIDVAGRRQEISVCSSIFTRAILARGRRAQIPESRIRRTVQQAVEDPKGGDVGVRRRGAVGLQGLAKLGRSSAFPATVSSWASDRRWGLAGAASTEEVDEGGPLIEERRVRHRG